MELQFQESGIRTLEDVLRDVRRLELTQEIRLGDAMPDIGRVLTAWGQVHLRSKEWNREEMQVAGGVMVWVMYLPEDGTEPRCVENWIPFQMKWDLPEGPEGMIRVGTLLRFADGRGISARKMMVRAGISVMVQALRRTERTVFTPGEMPENVELLRRTYPVRLPREAGERVFQLDEELAFPESEPVPEKILSYGLSPVISEKKVLSDKLVFKGKGNLHLVYRCQEGKLRSADLEVPFSQFADLDGVYSEDARADIWPAITNLELDVPENGKIRVKAGVVGQYQVDDRQLLEITEDAYSPFRDVNRKSMDLKLPAILDVRTESLAAEQTLTGQSGDVVDMVFLPDFPLQKRRGDLLELEVPGQFQVLYYGQDGSIQAGSAKWEGRISLAADERTTVCSMMLPAVPESSCGAEIRMQAHLNISLHSSAVSTMDMVTGLELGEYRDPDPSRPALILCRPNGEELWEIAKRCGSTVAAIRSANDLQSETVPERMLLIPVS